MTRGDRSQRKGGIEPERWGTEPQRPGGQNQKIGGIEPELSTSKVFATTCSYGCFAVRENRLIFFNLFLIKRPRADAPRVEVLQPANAGAQWVAVFRNLIDGRKLAALEARHDKAGSGFARSDHAAVSSLRSHSPRQAGDQTQIAPFLVLSCT